MAGELVPRFLTDFPTCFRSDSMAAVALAVLLIILRTRDLDIYIIRRDKNPPLKKVELKADVLKKIS
jgi:hypothetical protein